MGASPHKSIESPQNCPLTIGQHTVLYLPLFSFSSHNYGLYLNQRSRRSPFHDLSRYRSGQGA